MSNINSAINWWPCFNFCHSEDKKPLLPHLGCLFTISHLGLTPTCEKTLRVDILLYLFCERQKNLLFKAVNLAFSQVLKFTPLHFLLDPCYRRWAKVTTLLIFAVVLHLTPSETVPMHISTLHLWRLKVPLYPFLCGCEWQSIRESFLTVKFIRHKSKVLWGKCWNKTPTEEVLEGIKHNGGRCSVMILKWQELSRFLKLLFIPKNRAENRRSLPNSSGGLLCHCAIWYFSLINCMLYL